MDTIFYMAVYSDALEAFSDFDEEYGTAQESFKKEMVALANKHNENMANVQARFATAYSAGDKKGALQALDEFEKIVDEYRQDLKGVKPEKFTGLKFIAKVALAIIGIAIIIKSSSILGKIVQILGTFGPTQKLASTLLAKGAKGTASRFVAANVIGGTGFKAITPLVKDLILRKDIDSKKKFAEENPDEAANAKSVLYRKSAKTLDESKQIIAMARTEVNKMPDKAA